MGREIRRVPPNWEHPQEEKFDVIKRCYEMRYKPLYGECVEDRWAQWVAEFEAWKNGGLAECMGKHPDLGYSPDRPYRTFCDWYGHPPDPEYYRPSWDESEATWWQVYETVSEGTPVTPPFATQDELIDYLVENGDFWDQSRRKEGNSTMGCDPWSREQAEHFVRGPGWAPSMVVTETATERKIQSGVEWSADQAKEKD